MQAEKDVGSASIDLADDAAFDDSLPVRLRLKSAIHFTPVDVARRAATLLAPKPGMTVLDVGAGPGKFCITAALAVPDVQFHGVELRPRLVRLARRLATRWSVSNVRFIQGNALELDWSGYDAFYFFNPFAEQQFLDPWFFIDETIDLHPLNFLFYVRAVRRRLARVRLGTRLVTYQGYGARPPSGFELAPQGSYAVASLELWIKTSVSDESVGEAGPTDASNEMRFYEQFVEARK